MRCFVYLCSVLVCCITSLGASPPVEKIEIHETWFVIMMNDVRIGYRFAKDIKIKSGQQISYRTEHLEHLKVKRLGQLVESTTSLTLLENEFGEIQSFEQKVQSNGQGDAVSKGKLLAGQLNVETMIAGRSKLNSVKPPLLAVSPEYPARYLRTNSATLDVPLTFNIFSPSNLTFNQVKFSKQGIVEQKLLDGKNYSLTKVSLLHTANSGVKAYYLLDEQGEIRYASEETIVGKLAAYRVSKEIALEDFAGSQIDVSISTMFEPKPKLKQAHRAEKIVYQISAPQGNLDWKFSKSRSHDFKQISADTIQLTANKVELPEFATINANKKLDDYLESCLKPALLIQSDAPEIISLANLTAGSNLNPALIAKMQEQYIFKKMSKNQFSSNLGSALEVSKSWQGDCTEHAVLLCALLRAKKIPARIVIGMIYLDSYQAFSGHMWTEVFLDNDWYPLDATVGQGGISPAYLKISDTPLSENAAVPTSLLVPLLNIPMNLQIKIISEK